MYDYLSLQYANRRFLEPCLWINKALIFDLYCLGTKKHHNNQDLCHIDLYHFLGIARRSCIRSFLLHSYGFCTTLLLQARHIQLYLNVILFASIQIKLIIYHISNKLRSIKPGTLQEPSWKHIRPSLHDPRFIPSPFDP